MKAELVFPPELIQSIAKSVMEELRPFLTAPKTDADHIFDVKGLAAYLGIKDQRVYEAANLGGIPFFKVGKFLRFRKSAIDEWIKSQSIPVTRTLRVVK